MISTLPLQQTPVQPIRIVSIGERSRFVDFGRSVFGTVELTVRCTDSSPSLTIHLGEKLAEADRLDRAPGASIRYRSLDIQLRSGVHSYRAVIPPDSRNTDVRAVKMPESVGEVMPFRYCEVEGLGPTVELVAIQQWFVHAEFDDSAARFESSSQTLNEIWDLCKHTIKATTFCGYYVDGDRERIPYEGDAYINQLSHYCLDSRFEMGKSTLEYLLKNPTWPTDWHLHMPLIFWYDFLYSGDDSLLKKHYDILKLKTLYPLAGDDHLIRAGESPKKEWLKKELGFDSFFGGRLDDMVDWPRGDFQSGNLLGEADGYVFSPANTAVNALHHRSLCLTERIARHLGESEDATFFRDRAAQVAARINETLFDRERGIYVDGDATDHASQHANFYPLWAGLVPDSRRPSVVSFVKSRGMACSVYGAQHLLDALYKNDESAYALSLLTATDERSWHHMIHGVGSTMTLEAWDEKFKPNLDWNHAWGAAPTNIIVRRLLGVRPGAPGFTSAIIDPKPAGLEWAKATVPTPLGPIHIEITGHPGENPVVDLELPEGMTRIQKP